MGLVEAISLISKNGITIGYMMYGQVLDVENKESVLEQAVKTAESYNLDSKMLVNELNKMQVTDYKTVISATNIMEMYACYLWHNQIISIRTDSLLRHLNNYIFKHLSEDLSIELLCKYLSISKSTLNKISKAHFKMGISNYICLKRIEQLKNLLKDGSLLISEIGIQVGLPDANYFTKLFKKQTGFTPNEYKRRFK